MLKSASLMPATDSGDLLTDPGVMVGSSSIFFMSWLPWKSNADEQEPSLSMVVPWWIPEFGTAVHFLFQLVLNNHSGFIRARQQISSYWAQITDGERVTRELRDERRLKWVLSNGWIWSHTPDRQLSFAYCGAIQMAQKCFFFLRIFVSLCAKRALHLTRKYFFWPSFQAPILHLFTAWTIDVKTEETSARLEATLVPLNTVRWSNFDRQDPKMRVFLQSTEATPCGHLLKWKLTPENPPATPCSWPPWPWFSREKSLKIFKVL